MVYSADPDTGTRWKPPPAAPQWMGPAGLITAGAGALLTLGLAVRLYQSGGRGHDPVIDFVLCLVVALLHPWTGIPLVLGLYWLWRSGSLGLDASEDVSNTIVKVQASPKRGSLGLDPSEDVRAIGWSHYRQASYAEAVNAFQRAVALAPDNAETWRVLGWSHYHQASYAEAVNAFQRAVALAPDNADAWRGLGWSHYVQASYAEAVKAFQRAVALAPDNANAWCALGGSHYVQASYAEAVNAFQRAVALAPDDANAWRLLGLARAGKGDGGWEKGTGVVIA